MSTAPPVMKSVGEMIRLLREARGWSRLHLAKASEFDDSYLGKMERGQKGTSPVGYQRLADALGVPLAALFELPSRRRGKHRA